MDSIPDLKVLAEGLNKMDILQTVARHIKDNDLLCEDDKIVVGLSGGVDSCVMLHILKRLGYDLVAVHINHLLRGQNANSDAGFAADFAEKEGIPFRLFEVDVRDWAQTHKMGIEEAGRNRRYAMFKRVMHEMGCQKIATAHNQNDNSETMIMNLVRGCGMAGLCGMPVKNGNVIRPVLGLDRTQIEQYAQQNNIAFITDESNAEDIYTRNKIRNQVMPVLTDINPSLNDTLMRLAKIVEDQEQYMDYLADQYIQNHSQNKIDAAHLCAQESALAMQVIKKMLPVGAEYVHVQSVFGLCQSGKTGKQISLPGGKIAVLSYGKLVIRESVQSEPYSYELLPGQSIYVQEADKTFICSEATSEQPDDPNSKTFCGGQIVIRSRKQGDKIFDGQMTKKVKDLLIDCKVDRQLRDHIPIVEIDGQIVWVVPYRARRQDNGQIQITWRDGQHA